MKIYFYFIQKIFKRILLLIFDYIESTLIALFNFIPFWNLAVLFLKYYIISPKNNVIINIFNKYILFFILFYFETNIFF